MKNSLWLFFAKNSFFFISAKVFYFGIIVAHLLSPSTQCENYENLLSQFFHKNFVKATFSVNKLLKRSTLGNVFSMRVIFSFFYTVSNTRNMSVNISVDSLETLEETFFFLVGKDNISFWGSCVQEKKPTEKCIL